MKFSRGFAWLPILAAVAIVFGVSGGAYWYGQQQNVVRGTPNPVFSASSTTGSAPLGVHFVMLDDSGHMYQAGPYKVEYGDGQSGVMDFTTRDITQPQSIGNYFSDYVYETPGTYTARLINTRTVCKMAGCNTVGEVTITVAGIKTNTVSAYTVSELGIKFYIPNTLSDVVHKVVKFPTDQAVNTVGFSTRRLETAGCDAKSAPLGYLTYNKTVGGEIIAHVRNSDLYYIKPDGTCKAYVSLQNWQLLRDILKTLVTDYKGEEAAKQVSVPSVIDYANVRYGFSFKYPSNLILNTKEDGFTSAGDVTLYVKSGQYYPYISFKVATDIVSCDRIPGYREAPIMYDIGGTVFAYTDESNCGAGSCGRTRQYSVVKNNLCYRIQLSHYPINKGGDDNELADVVKEILGTMKFTAPTNQ